MPSIFRQGDGLAASTSGEPIARPAAEVRDVFFTPGSPRRSIALQRDASGRIAGYVSRRDERDLPFSKIHDIERASRIIPGLVVIFRAVIGTRLTWRAWRQPRLRKLGCTPERLLAEAVYRRDVV